MAISITQTGLSVYDKNVYSIIVHGVWPALWCIRLFKMLQLFYKGLAEFLSEHWESEDPWCCKIHNKENSLV